MHEKVPSGSMDLVVTCLTLTQGSQYRTGIGRTGWYVYQYWNINVSYLKRIKIRDKAWRAQQVHAHGPKGGRAHSLCGVPDETKAQTCPPRFRSLKTCPTRKRLVLQGKDLGYKERRQDLTTIKALTPFSHQGTHNWPLSSTLEL